MKKKKINKKPRFKTNIAVRLWLIMMSLVILSIAFIWVVQIVLFEKNYINSAAAEVQNRLNGVENEINIKELSDVQNLLASISKSTSTKVVLIDSEGQIVDIFSAGHRLDSEGADAMAVYLKYLKESEEYANLFKGEQYTRIIKYGSTPIALEIGIPVLYNDKNAAIMLYETMDQLNTVLKINRRQLVVLSIVLTVIAAGIAALLSRYFVKPIHTIKNTVNKLAEGDLTATPGLKLNDELGELSDSVDQLGHALQKVDVLRKEVISNVSHELRSPLALIRGYAEMVRDISYSDDEKRNEDLNLIIDESGRMSEMVNDILDYSKLQAGYTKLNKEWCNIYELVESEITHYRKIGSEYGVDISFESTSENISVYVDALKMNQVIRNLLNNAVNHTPSGESVIATLHEGDSKIKVSVQNPGEPIPEEDRKIIWERYQISQHSGSRKQGTGIGLSIVSTVLNAHGIKYGVDCEDGKNIFWFEYVKEKT